MTERNPQPLGTPPPGWPSPKRMAVLMEAIRQGVERYREEFEKRERDENTAGRTPE